MDHLVSSNFNSVIANVRKLQLIPPVYVYTVASHENGLSAVDVDQHNLHLAYSLGHSNDICITLDYHSEDIFDGNLSDAWKKHVAARDLKKRKKKKAENNSASSLCVFQHGADVTGLQFTPDANLLLSCALDGTVKAWNVDSFRLVETYYGTSRAFSDIHVSSDCKYFAASLSSQYHYCSSVASLYSFENKYPVSTFLGHTGDIECVRFHPNGLYIATAASDRTIRLWCTRNFKEVRKFQASGHHDGYPQKLTFSPDGNFLASAYSESVKIWDLASGKIIKCLPIPNQSPNILNLCYNTSGSILATGGSNKKLHLWNLKENSSESCDMRPENELLKFENLDKTVHHIKYTSNFFTCVAACES